MVSVEEPGQVEIPLLGVGAPADPVTPARFEVLTSEAGRYPISFTPGGRRRGGSGRHAGRHRGRAMRRRVLVLLVLAAAIGVAAVVAVDPPSAELAVPASPPPAREAPEKPPPAGPRPRCPAEAGNCREADGRILYVERVDPDGDGDAHFVLASRESVTAPRDHVRRREAVASALAAAWSRGST